VEAALAEPRCFPLKKKSHRLTPPKNRPAVRRLLWWAGIHRPAAAAACQSFFYDFYKK
jgi:hypothetical protein